MEIFHQPKSPDLFFIKADIMISKAQKLEWEKKGEKNFSLVETVLLPKTDALYILFPIG